MLISVVQFKAADTDEIGEKGISMLETSLKDNPDLIILQELFNSIYFPQYEEKGYFCIAEEIPGKTTDRILKIIKGKHITVVAPIFEKSDNSYYCSAAILDSRRGVVGVYRKLHLPTLRSLHETYYFKSGDYGHQVFEMEKANIAVMLCYDRHFPESARLYGLRGTDLLCVAAATPKSAKHIWFTEMQAHAFSNSYYCACSNRTGTENKIDFLGQSFICDYHGSILAQAGENDDAIITAEIDIESARNARRESSFYRDRRPELYSSITD